MIHPDLEFGMCIYVAEYKNIHPGIHTSGKYYAIYYEERYAGKGGFPPEAVKIIEALGIPTENHWNSAPSKYGWRASHYIRVQNIKTLDYSLIHHKIQDIMPTLFSNERFQSLLKSFD